MMDTKIRLGEIAELITKGTTPTTLGFDYIEKGINFIKIESITEEGDLNPLKFAHIDDECNNKLMRSQLKENDIQLTDEQLLFIFNYSQTGVKALDSFR